MSNGSKRRKKNNGWNQKGVQKLGVRDTAVCALLNTEFKRGFAHLDHEGVLLLYTDGLIERKSKAGHQFGIQRLKNFS